MYCGYILNEICCKYKVVIINSENYCENILGIFTIFAMIIRI